MEWVFNPEIWISLVTLTVLEIVLGIDNVVFISILAEKLPESEQKKARRVGLGLAVVTRILLLFSLTWLMSLTKPLFSIPSLGVLPEAHPVSVRDLILLLGGLFLLGKATYEIHEKLEVDDGARSGGTQVTFSGVILQIILLDVVFSLDSVITAVGMVKYLGVMVAAVIIAVGLLLIFAELVHEVISDHPTLKMLALSFLILIGVALVAESFHQEVPKGYIYFSMAFAAGVETLNIKMRKRYRKAGPVKLHQPYR